MTHGQKTIKNNKLSAIFDDINTMNLQFAPGSASNVNFLTSLKEAVIAWSACSQFSSSAPPPSNFIHYFHSTSSGWLQHIRRSINSVDNLLDAHDIIFHKQLTSSAHFTLFIKHAFIGANKLYNSINAPWRQLRWWCKLCHTVSILVVAWGILWLFMKLRVLKILPDYLIIELNILHCPNGLNILSRLVVPSDSGTMSMYSRSHQK
jgi:hypothetical protein